MIVGRESRQRVDTPDYFLYLLYNPSFIPFDNGLKEGFFVGATQCAISGVSSVLMKARITSMLPPSYMTCRAASSLNKRAIWPMI
jgi:hypothetical protein